MIFTSVVPSPCPTQTLCEYLTRRFTYHDDKVWMQKIIDGRILINDVPALPTTPVISGDTVAYDAPEIEEPPADTNFKIIYEDPWLLAVNKPGNLLVHRNGRSIRNNLIYLLRHTGTRQFPDADIVHRLDRETSGIVLVSLDTTLLKDLHRQIAGGTVEKEYIAIVHGIPKQQGVIDLPIGPDTQCGFPNRFCIDPQKGKRSVTVIKEIKPLGAHASLVRLSIETGRTHQIRIHLAHLGAPVFGDKLYGDESLCATPLINRQALHCSSLGFYHCFLGTAVKCCAPLPVDMCILQNRLASGASD